MTIDIARLRRDLEDYYGTGMVGASPLAMMDLSEVETASYQKLISMAQNAGFDLGRYMLDD